MSELASTGLICSTWAFESSLRPVLAAASITWKGWITSVLEVTGTTVTTPCPSSAATVLARLDSGSIEAMSGVRQARSGQ